MVSQLWQTAVSGCSAGLLTTRFLLLWRAGAVAEAHGLCCCPACGIFPSQRLSLGPLHWPSGFLTTGNQESLRQAFCVLCFTVHAKLSQSCLTDSVQPQRTIACQAPLCTDSPARNTGVELPWLSPSPDPAIKPASLMTSALAGCLFF